MADVQAAVATAAKHFTALDDASQEIYFTCTPYKMWHPVEILPGSWAGTLSSFSVIEVRKRPKRNSSTQEVREQAAALGPRQQQPRQLVAWWTTQVDAILTILCNFLRLTLLIILIISAIWASGHIIRIVCRLFAP